MDIRCRFIWKNAWCSCRSWWEACAWLPRDLTARQSSRGRCHFASSPVVSVNSCSRTSSPGLGAVSDLDGSHSHRCVVVAPCFSLQFPNDVRELSIFSYARFSSSYIIFGEVSVQIFWPLLKSVSIFFLKSSLYTLDTRLFFFNQVRV